jgi:hypothetical protein
VKLQIQKCRLGGEPARCVQFSSDAIQTGEIYIQVNIMKYQTFPNVKSFVLSLCVLCVLCVRSLSFCLSRLIRFEHTKQKKLFFIEFSIPKSYLNFKEYNQQSFQYWKAFFGLFGANHIRRESTMRIFYTLHYRSDLSFLIFFSTLLFLFHFNLFAVCNFNEENAIVYI